MNKKFLEMLQAWKLSLSGVNFGELPETVKKSVKEFAEKIDSSIEAMKAAPDEAGKLLELMTASFADFSRSFTQTWTDLKTLSETHVSLNGKLTDFNTKITNGDLITKEKAKEMADAARVDGEKVAREGFKVVNDRRLSLASANVPEPMNESALAGDDTAFNARKDAAIKRAKELKEKFGLALNSKLVREYAWVEQAAYDKEVVLLTEVIKPGGAGNIVEPVFGGGSSGQAFCGVI